MADFRFQFPDKVAHDFTLYGGQPMVGMHKSRDHLADSGEVMGLISYGGRFHGLRLSRISHKRDWERFTLRRYFGDLDFERRRECHANAKVTRNVSPAPAIISSTAIFAFTGALHSQEVTSHRVARCKRELD